MDKFGNRLLRHVIKCTYVLQEMCAWTNLKLLCRLTFRRTMSTQNYELNVDGEDTVVDKTQIPSFTQSPSGWRGRK